jgi:hypothetical protein
MTRNDIYPVDDNCVPCSVDEYLLTPVTIENKSIVCANCPVGGFCPGLFLIFRSKYGKNFTYQTLIT